MTSRPVQEYHLFLDESGEFMETSTMQHEREKGAAQRFASQVVGFLAPNADNITEEAQDVMRRCFEVARIPPRAEFHATKESVSTVNVMVQQLAQEMEARGWQPVRLVNQEHVTYGDRVTTYTNMVAELVLRLFQEKSKHSKDRVAIKLVGDLVSLPERTAQGHPYNIPKRAFKDRVQEYLGFAAVRRGLTREALKWDFPSVRLDIGVKRPELQICDLISNASYDDYRRCWPRTRRLLCAAFGVYDQTMETYDLLEHVDRLIEDQAFGLTLILIAEHVNANGGQAIEGVGRRLDHCINRLTQLGTRGRDAQLTILIAWLDQLVGQRRLLEAGYKVAHWLIDSVDAPLRDGLQFSFEEHTLDWFAYAVRRWALTAANHRGTLLDAERELRAMQQLQTALAHQWERAALLMDGFIVQAVHQTDCFDFEQAAAQARWVADSLKEQSRSLQLLLGSAPPQPIRYDLRGKALGTLVQCLTLGGLNDAENIARARDVSDEAIAEFSSLDDQARQYQYRCHLETVAGDLAAARKFLVKSLRPMIESPESTSHKTIQYLISNLDLGQNLLHRFAPIHWLRLGAAICRRGSPGEREDFLEALTASKLLHSDWCMGKISEPPAHLALRYVATIHASLGDGDKALRSLSHLRTITPPDENHLILALILFAAHVEVTALLWGSEHARALLGGSSDSRGLEGLLAVIRANGAAQFPAILSLVEEWEGGLARVSEGAPGQEAVEELLRMADRVRY